MSPDDAFAFAVGVLAFFGLALVERIASDIPGDPFSRLYRSLFLSQRRFEMKTFRYCLALLTIAVTLGAMGIVMYLGDVPRFLAILFAGSCGAAMSWPDPEPKAREFSRERFRIPYEPGEEDPPA